MMTMTTAIDNAPLGCRQPPLGAAVSRLLGHPLPSPLREHVGQCLACQLERRAFEQFERSSSAADHSLVQR
jgi:hypothetical protein